MGKNMALNLNALPSDNSDSPWRYERKYTFPESLFEPIQKSLQIHPAMFSAAYASRWINNIYFDSDSYRSYDESVSGQLDRKKYRIRWYGEPHENAQNPTVEVKIKHGALGRKELFSLGNFKVQCIDWRMHLAAALASSTVPPRIAIEIQNRRPVLFNRYLRQYMISGDGKFRLTLDRNISYFQSDFQWWGTESREANAVLEIKYHSNDDSEAMNICADLPLRLSKNSKFQNGIERFI